MRFEARGLTVIMVTVLMAAALMTGPLYAGSYPSKPIKLYYGYGAGGTCHTSLQPLTKALEKILNQSVVLVEKPGAGATIAGGVAAKSRPDGYTLAVIKSTTITTAPHILNLPYSPQTDLVHLFAYAGPASGFTVKADAPWNTWQDFIAYAKANPGKVAWTATGSTGTQYLLMQYIGKQEGLRWNGVPAKGGSAAMKLVLGGQVAGYASSGSHVPQIKSGNARELVDFGVKSSFPGVPTLEEVGYKGLAIKGEPYIVVASKKLPEDIRKTLVDALSVAVKDPGYQAIVQKLDLQEVNLSGPELDHMLESGSALVTKLLKSAGRI